MRKEEIKKIIKENNISYIRMQFTDMLGELLLKEIVEQVLKLKSDYHSYTLIKQKSGLTMASHY